AKSASQEPDVSTNELFAALSPSQPESGVTQADEAAHDARDTLQPRDDEQKHASIARAIARLWRRGLVQLSRAFASEATATELTDAGGEAASASRRSTRAEGPSEV